MMELKPYPLKKLIIPSQQAASVDPGKLYKQIRLRGSHKGAELRGLRKGEEILSKQFIASTGQFIISKIDARHGAMAIVSQALDQAVVTGDFLLYDFNTELVDPDYFKYIIQHESFGNACNVCSEGSTNRVRLKVSKFHDLELLLPEVQAQRKISQKISAVLSKIDTIREIRLSQKHEIDNLLYSRYQDMVRDAEWLPFHKVAPIIRRKVSIQDNALYPELGIRSFGKGTFHKPPLTGLEIATKKIYQIKKGDLIFSNVFAWEGAIAVAGQDDDDLYGSHRFISCLADTEKAIPEFLCFHFLTQQGLEDINSCSPGGAGRNKTLGLQKLMQVKVPVPSPEAQKEFISLVNHTRNLKDQHAEIAQALELVFPSLLDKAFNGEL